jgi:ABC-type phosphate/phosphonate transport system substrate-binding protein
VIDAVLDGEADVAAVDGYGLDLLRKHDPALTVRLRVVATTSAAPSPPLVASRKIDAPTRERLSEALETAHGAPEIATTLEELLLARFVRVGPDDFRLFLDRQRAAEEAGYPKLV